MTSPAAEPIDTFLFTAGTTIKHPPGPERIKSLVEFATSGQTRLINEAIGKANLEDFEGFVLPPEWAEAGARLYAGHVMLTEVSLHLNSEGCRVVYTFTMSSRPWDQLAPVDTSARLAIERTSFRSLPMGNKFLFIPVEPKVSSVGRI